MKKKSLTKIGTLVLAIGLGIAISISGVKNAHAIPSFARQTGFACNVCHTTFPHLTPFGRDFKLHGYVMDTAECVKVSGGDTKMCGVDINRIPMLSVRIVSIWSNQAGGNNGIVPRGVTTAGQGFMSYPSGYGDTDVFNLVGDSSVYLGGKIAPNIGTFLELTGINDEGGSLGLGIFDLALVAPDTTLGDKQFTYGIRAVDSVGMADPSNTYGMWGLTSTLLGMSTHNTLYDPNRAMVEGGELYGMWGDFNSGAIYAHVGVYHPTANQTGTSFVQGNIAGSGVFNGSSKVDEAVRLAYYFPEYNKIYAQLGVSGYFGKEGIMAPTTSTIANPLYNDNYYNYDVDLQIQLLGDENLAELFAIYQSQNDDKFYGQDVYTGTDYGANGTSVTRNGFGVMVDYYYKRTYGAYIKYLYQDSSKVQDLDVQGTTIGLSWYPFENINLLIEQTLFSKYNPGEAQYGSTSLAASDFNVTAVKLEYLF